jgi:branched-chain amino acid transport system permease protein
VTPYIVSGLVLGSIYAISALGLVLTYTSSRVFNFAHGAIAFSMAVLHYYLARREGWDLLASAGFIVLVVAPLLGLGLWAALFRHLTHVSPTVRLVSTVGLWVALPALTYLLFPWAKEEIYDPTGLVHRPLGIHELFDLPVIGRVVLNDDQAAVLIAAFAVAVLATLLMRATPLGLAIRAAVDHPRNAAIAGIDTEGVTAVSWVIGTMLAALAGILLAPVQHGLNITFFTLLLVASFGAAVVGRIRSLPLTFAGAMLIGLLQGIWPKVYTDWFEKGWLKGFNNWFALTSEGVKTPLLSKGFQASIPFIVMIAFLLAYKDLRREAFTVDPRGAQSAHGEAPPLPPAHGWRRAAGPLALAVVALSVPLWLSDIWVVPVTQGIALGVIFLSYTMVTGEGGLISLCQVSLAGIGGFGAALAVRDAGFPVWAAILFGGLVSVPFGLLVALPSLRIGDLYLALLTLAFALLIENFLFIQNVFDNFGAGVELPRPFGLGIIDSGDRALMYYIVAGVFGVVALLVVNLKRATTGLVFAAIRSSEPAALTTGISIVRAKLMVFSASAFIAGLGGALYASVVGRANVRAFVVLIGIVWLAIVVTWGVRSVIGALMAGLLYSLIQQRLILLIVMIFLFVVVGVLVRLLLAKRYQTARGLVGLAVVAAVAVVGTWWILGIRDSDHERQTELAAHILLVGVWAGMTLPLLARLGLRRAYRKPVGALATLAVGALVVLGTAFIVQADLAESAHEVPTMMFGLGAVALAREPRGVIYDMVNRQRLRQLQDLERRRKREAARTAATAGVGS